MSAQLHALRTEAGNVYSASDTSNFQYQYNANNRLSKHKVSCPFLYETVIIKDETFRKEFL